MIGELHLSGSALFCGSGWGQAHQLLLTNPLRVITGTRSEELPAALDEVERELAAGRPVAGFMCYEAGRVLGLETHEPSNLVPLFWFGAYETGTVADLPSPALAVGPVPDLRLNVTRDEYCAAIGRIKEYIAAGDTYQVNYTCHARFEADLDPAAYFLAMVDSHPVPYAAYLNIGAAQIISISPELLLAKRGPILTTKPMKGTRKRGRTPGEDAALRTELTTSLKDRAENLMIVDMMRNDLGRICEIGSVGVPALFEPEQYGSVWQMTTTVTGRLQPGTSLREIMAAVLPGSSVTGAPKKRTMEIIRELEREPRGVYCAVGLMLPNGSFTLNLPIRTLVHRDGKYDLGIGAGIVWDSVPLDEYEETLLKSQFTRRLAPDLRLFETMLVEPRGPGHPGPANGPSGTSGPTPVQGVPAHAPRVAYESEHLARLAQSADYWGFPFEAEQARQGLARFREPCVVRMELDRQGTLDFSSRPLPPAPAAPVRVLISDQRTNSADRLLYHKTNQRALYDTERERAAGEGCFEVLFGNEEGNATEGAISNLFVQREGRWLTPSLMDGLLPGLWRAHFMAQMGAIEAHVTPEMLAEAEAIIIGNSVRGAIRVDEVVYGGCTIYRR